MFTKIAWLLCYCVIVVSLVYVWSYGVEFGASNASKWLTSFMLSVVLNIVCVYPLTVSLNCGGWWKSEELGE